MKSSVIGLILSILVISCNFNSTQEGVKVKKIDLRVSEVFEENGNVFVQFLNDSTKQLTFNGSDFEPIYLNKEYSVLFIRNVKELGNNGVYARKKIMKVSINDLNEMLVTEYKPYKDGNDNTNQILSVINPTLSSDENFLFFNTEKWATANQLVKVELETGKWFELFSSDSFELIKSGDFKGKFIISKSEIRDKGRDDYYKLVNDSGEVIKEFANKKAMNDFKMANL